MKRWLIVIVIFLVAPLSLIAIGVYAGVRQITGYGWSVYGPASIWMPYDRLLLVRNGDHFAAVKFVEPISHKGGTRNGAKYVYWYTGDGSGDLTDPDVEHGAGIVFEKYTQTQIRPGHYMITDAGGELNIRAGPLWMRWSLSNHVYAQPAASPSPLRPVKIAATCWTDVSEIDLSDPELRWIGDEHASDPDENISNE